MDKEMSATLLEVRARIVLFYLQVASQIYASAQPSSPFWKPEKNCSIALLQKAPRRHGDLSIWGHNSLCKDTSNSLEDMCEPVDWKGHSCCLWY